MEPLSLEASPMVTVDPRALASSAAMRADTLAPLDGVVVAIWLKPNRSALPPATAEISNR